MRLKDTSTAVFSLMTPPGLQVHFEEPNLNLVKRYQSFGREFLDNTFETYLMIRTGKRQKIMKRHGH
jgi:hypothetical protein